MEIGSEFWLENKNKKNKVKYEIDKKSEDKLLFMSGRTAIDYALDVVARKRQIKNVYFPSYCCQSMLDPFLERNIDIDFYNVNFKDGSFVYSIDCNKSCDMFFAMNYFGYSCNNMDYYIEKFKKHGAIIIEDSTHSWLSKRKYNKNSDFIVASLRKWFPIISGGILINCSNNFDLNQNIELKENYLYNKFKSEAMKMKNNYINKKENIEKEKFLEEYSKANEVLKKDYKRYKIDKKSNEILKKLDIDDIYTRRRNNAKIIYDFLTNQENIDYIKEINFKEDCPIFVPIFLKNKNDRDCLKNKLIENQIYCPNHWNIPDIVKNNNRKNIYDRELSLICDQRYNIDDIINYIKYI